MQTQKSVTTRQIWQNELGPELCRYRRRSEWAIAREMGLIGMFCIAPFILAFGALVMAAPLILLADPARRPLIRDPFWGPVLAFDVVVNYAILAFLSYGWPRFIYLAIHEKGFVYRAYRRYAVRFQDVAQCIVSPNSQGLTLILRDSRRLWFQNFMIQFPAEGVVQLLERINDRLDSESLQVTPVDADLKTRFRRTGWVISLLMYAIVILVPICDAKARAVTVKVFGATVRGIPSVIFVPLLLAVLFLPLVYVGVQLMVLKSARLGTSTGLYNAKELRRARIAVFLGFLYFAALCTIWIVFAH